MRESTDATGRLARREVVRPAAMTWREGAAASTARIVAVMGLVVLTVS